MWCELLEIFFGVVLLVSVRGESVGFRMMQIIVSLLERVADLQQKQLDDLQAYTTRSMHWTPLPCANHLY